MTVITCGPCAKVDALEAPSFPHISALLEHRMRVHNAEPPGVVIPRWRRVEDACMCGRRAGSHDRFGNFFCPVHGMVTR